MKATLGSYVWVSVVFTVLLLAGCSSGRSPLVPINTIGEMQNISSLPVGVSDFTLDGKPSEGMGALGLFSVRINPSDMSADIVSLRQSALMDVLEVVDITNFLTMAPCTKCVKVKSVALDSDGNVVVAVGIRHPFLAGDPYKPITGKNRADLHVFNIEGIVISNATAASFPGLGESVAGFRLLNADGYTKYLDTVIDAFYPTDASIHPYVMHFDDYMAGNFSPTNSIGFASVTDPPPTGNLVMAMGCDYNYQDYVFGIDAPFEFVYAVGCTYALSAATKSMRFTPEYRIPQHNKKAASEVSIVVVSNNLSGGMTSSSAQIEVHVVDINHGIAVGDALDQMRGDSSVGSVAIDVPGVMSSPVTIGGGSSVSGTGHSPSDPLVYQASITNTSGAAEGKYIGLVKVNDTYNPGQNGSPLLNGMDGISRVDPLVNPLTGVFAISEFATYQAFTIDVGPFCIPPVPTSIDPDILSTAQGNCHVTIMGSNFQGAGGVTSVYLDNGIDQIYATNINVVSDTELTCELDVSDADEGVYDLVVFTACAGRGIDLVQIGGYPMEWVSVGYNHADISQNPNPQALDPLNLHTLWSNTTSGSPSGFKPTGLAIANNKVFFLCEPSGYYYSSAQYSLYCLDLGDGHQIWRNFINPSSKYARALGSPFWYENKIYAPGDKLYCYNDNDGSVVWSYDGLAHNFFFIGNSPKVLNGRAFCTSRSGFFVCVDAQTGVEQWTYPYEAGELHPATDGERVYFPSQTYLHCVNAIDGSFVWKNPLPNQAVAWSGPVVWGDRVYQNGWSPGSLYCFDKYTGTTIWNYSYVGAVYMNAMPAPYIDQSDGKLVLVSGGATSGSPLIAVKDDGTTYSTFWSSTLGGNRYFDGSAATLGNYVIVGDRFAPQLLVVNKSDGSLAKSYTLQGSISGQPAIAFDRLVIMTDNSIDCYF